MKKIIALIAAVFVCFGAFAQGVDKNKAIQEINKATSSLTSFQCDFVQTKTLKMLGDKMVSKGVMYFQQPEKLRWEYTTPYTYSFILNGNKVMLQKGKRSDVIDVNQNKMFKEIARIMMNSVLGKSLNDTKDFRSSITQKNDYYIITLVPLKKEMKQMFSKIVLSYNRKVASVTKVQLTENNGDNTVIDLQNIKKNQKINGSLFTVK